MDEPTCPDCGHVIPIVNSRNDPRWRWARHTVTGSLNSSDGPECLNSGAEYEDENDCPCGGCADMAANPT